MTTMNNGNAATNAAAASGNGTATSQSQTSLFVGNLDQRVYRELLTQVFSQAGRVTQCHIVYDKTTGQSSGFGFVHYEDHATAESAMERFRGRSIYGKLLTIDWARASNNNNSNSNSNNNGEQNVENNNEYCLFVGNLSPNVTDEQLVTAFSEFGSCTSAKCAKNPITYETQGYAFVSFRERSDAVSAMQAMNGQLLNNRPLRVDWAKGKTNSNGNNDNMNDSNKSNFNNNNKEPMTFEAILSQTSVNNITAYVSGLPLDTNEDVIRDAFIQFGPIRDIRIPESAKAAASETMYAFVRYMDHASAAKAIFESQQGGTQVAGKIVNVHWGRETIRRYPPTQQHQQHQHLQQQQQRQMFNPAAAAAFPFQQFQPHNNAYFPQQPHNNFNNPFAHQQQQPGQQQQQQQQSQFQPQPQQGYGYGFHQQFNDAVTTAAATPGGTGSDGGGNGNGAGGDQQVVTGHDDQGEQHSPRYQSQQYGRGAPPGPMHQPTATAQHRYRPY